MQKDIKSNIPILEMDQVTKRFGHHVAVNDLSLTVHRGDILGLLGPNGSGKTTTLRMALGLITPTSGTISLFGYSLAQSRQRQLALRRVGSLIEYPFFYPYLNARENLQVMARLSGWSEAKHIECRITKVIEQVALTRYSNIPFKRYSLGMKQRLGIGAALLTSPELLLLDEPTNGLDPDGIHDIRTLLTLLARQGTTLIVSSHLLHEVQQICTRVAILKEGCLLVQGTVRELLQDKGSLYLSFPSVELRDKAQRLLQQVRSQEAPWITNIQPLQAEAPEAALELDAPHTHSADLCALLAQQEIYPAEMRRQSFDLEQVFFALTQRDSVLTQVPV